MFKELQIRISVLLIVITILLSQNNTVFAENLTSENQDNLNKEIETFLKDNYDGYYELSNFRFTYNDSEEFVDNIEILVSCDMKLIKTPGELPLLQGMKSALNSQGYKSSKFSTYNNFLGESTYEILKKEVEENYYDTAEKTFFNFILPKDSKLLLKNLKLLSYKEIIDLNSLKINEESLYNIGEDIIKEAYEKQDLMINYSTDYKLDNIFKNRENLDKSLYNISNYSSGYDRIGARDYALAHAYDKPEYESDCANFVSKSLCYGGGIPQTSAWKPGSNNWIRTGYYEGGVVPYMVNNGYFYKENDRRKVNAGSIVYWNTFSHVGLITYGDTVTIKYTAHTTARKNEVLPPSTDVSFYMYR